MSNYLASEIISVYPSARRGITKPESRLVTESALVGIVNKLIDKTGFVITNPFQADRAFEFNIYGYYFKVATGQAITSLFPSAATNSTIYGVIHLDSLDPSVVELAGQDEDNVYTGIDFTLTEPSSGYWVALLQKGSSGWVVPENSTFKFDFPDVDIDGGVIS